MLPAELMPKSSVCPSRATPCPPTFIHISRSIRQLESQRSSLTGQSRRGRSEWLKVTQGISLDITCSAPVLIDLSLLTVLNLSPFGAPFARHSGHTLSNLFTLSCFDRIARCFPGVETVSVEVNLFVAPTHCAGDGLGSPPIFTAPAAVDDNFLIFTGYLG